MRNHCFSVSRGKVFHHFSTHFPRQVLESLGEKFGTTEDALNAIVNQLNSEEQAKVYSNRLIRRCRIIERTDGHTYLELGFGLGEWWVLDKHWEGLRTEVNIYPYVLEGDLMHLRDFPYMHRPEEESEGWGISQCCAIAMCLKYFDACLLYTSPSPRD